MKSRSLELKRGDCILKEEPFVYILKSKYQNQRCDYCLKSNKVLKCSNCCYVYYCNRICQSNAWHGHKVECVFLKKIVPKKIPDAVRVLYKIIFKLQNGGDLERSYYTNNSYRRFKDLMSHYNEVKIDAKRREHLESIRVVLNDLLDGHLIPNEFELLGLYGRLITNGFNILDSDMNSIGTGIYIGASVTDHSCVPNAVATFEGTTLRIRVTEDMPCLDWSKVFISYIDLLNTKEDRLNELEANYYFLCTCSKCADPSEYILTGAAACGNVQCPEYINVENDTCQKCYKKVSVEHKNNVEEVTAFTMEQLEKMKDIAYLDVCEICLKRQKNVLHPLNIWHVKTLDLAFESAIDVNKFDVALDLGLQLIPGFRKYYGNWNPLLGLLYMKIAKIQLYQGCVKDASHTLNEAVKIIEVTHGRDHSLFKDVLMQLIVQARVESSYE